MDNLSLFYRDIGECDLFEIGGAPYKLTLYHSGTDGLELAMAKVISYIMDIPLYYVVLNIILWYRNP